MNIDDGHHALWAEAAEVLRNNDRGSWTRPSPRLYPHQWSWDSAFIAIGWAHLDPLRAVAELQTLFEAQWSNGMVPHIVFDPTVDESKYQPSPSTWRTGDRSPSGISTSGLCQPPVHALALARIRETAERAGDADELSAVDAAVRGLYPKLVAWHRYLHDMRDPDRTGLVTIFHPWESGMDNSPRWDLPLARVAVPEDAGRATDALNRPDLSHVSDPSERPRDEDYRRYLYLVSSLVALDHDPRRAMTDHPFRVGDVWFSAILAAADDALAGLVEGLALDPGSADQHRDDARRTRVALDRCWDPSTARTLDLDLVEGSARLACDTIAGFSALVAGTSPDRAAALVERLWSPAHAGHAGLAWALPGSTSPFDPAFDPRAYWRGPQWPPMTWLVWSALGRRGHRRSAERLRRTALDQLAATGCCEYVDPLSGEALGSPQQSWSAAVVLDWLAADERPGSTYDRRP